MISLGQYRGSCGSMTFWFGSGSADPCLWLMDLDQNPDPNSVRDPAIFVIDLQDASKKLNLKKCFPAYSFFKGTVTSFYKEKKSKRSNKTVGTKSFLPTFALMILGSGSVYLTYRSRSRLKNIRILRIQIRNTCRVPTYTKHKQIF